MEEIKAIEEMNKLKVEQMKEIDGVTIIQKKKEIPFLGSLRKPFWGRFNLGLQWEKNRILDNSWVRDMESRPAFARTSLLEIINVQPLGCSDTQTIPIEAYPCSSVRMGVDMAAVHLFITIR